MEVTSSKSYPIGLKVVVAEMQVSDQFVDVNDKVEYDRDSDDMVVTVTYLMKEGKLVWVIAWLAVPDHDKKIVDSGLLMLAATARLLNKAPADDATVIKAKALIAEQLSKRPKED